MEQSAAAVVMEKKEKKEKKKKEKREKSKKDKKETLKDAGDTAGLVLIETHLRTNCVVVL